MMICGNIRKGDRRLESFRIHDRQINVFVPETAGGVIVYFHGDAQQAAEVWQLLSEPKPVLAALSGVDWNADLSPWPAKRAFRSGGDFSGCADDYLAELTEQIIPDLERAMGIVPMTRCLAGYSLAGLFTAYAPYRSALFDRIASMSGSLWFDGFAAFARRPFLRAPEYAYFSLGDREKQTRSARMAAVEDCTQTVVEWYRGCGVLTDFVINPGGHFQNGIQRVADGIVRMIRNPARD